MLNTIKYSKQLEAVGFSREQAEAHVGIIVEIIEGDMATKRNLKELEYRLVIKLSAIFGTLVSLAIAVTAALTKLVN